MLTVCLVMLLNSSDQENAINIKHIQAIEDRGSYAKIYMSSYSLSLATKDTYKKVLEKIKAADAACKL